MKKSVTLCFVFLPSVFFCLQMVAQGPAFSTEWKAKNFDPFVAYHDTTLSSAVKSVTVSLDPSIIVNKVRPTVFGNNMAYYQNKNSLTSSLKKQNYKNAANTLIRWPGGNASNTYFWDNNIPATYKGTEVNASKMHGGNGTGWELINDGYLQMLDTLGAQGMVCINASYAFYGSGTNPITDAAHYAANWVRYFNITKGKKVKYWEIGNENYGGWQAGYIVNGVQTMGNDYGVAFREIADSMKAADPDIYVGAVLYTNATGYDNWSALVLPEVQNHADFLILHEYFHPNTNRNAISEDDIYAAITKIKEDMANVDSMVVTYTDKPAGYFPVAMTEFNSRCGLREISRTNALFIAMCLGEFIKYDYDAVTMWNMQNGFNSIASGDAEDGDHGMVSNNDPDLPNYSANPSLYPFYYYNKYFGDEMIQTTSSNTNVMTYGSTFSSKEVGMVLINKGSSSQTVELDLSKLTTGQRMYWHTITGDGDKDRTVYINGVGPSGGANGVGGPQNYTEVLPHSALLTSFPAKITLPPYSLTFALIETDSVLTSVNIAEGKSSLVKVYPNPFNNQLNVQSDAFLQKIEVYSITGQLVGEWKNSLKNDRSALLNLNDSLQAGIYFVKVFTDESTEVVRIEKR